MRTGLRTTECWLAVAAQLLGTLLATGVLGQGTVAETIAGVAASALAALGYGYGRVRVKAVGQSATFLHALSNPKASESPGPG
jgi:uncharacterized protein (DUF697 family)